MHLCMASSIRAMPEKEKPPAMRVDLYLCKICYNIGAVTLSSREEVRRMNDPLIALAVAVVAGVAVHYICKWLDGQ